MSHVSYSTTDWDGVDCEKVVSFLFKFFQSPGGDRFDYLPRLIREPILFRPLYTPQSGEGSVLLKSSPSDPLGSVKVGKVVSMFYGKYHNTMLPGKVVTRIWNPLKFARHAFFKNDYSITLLEQFDPSKSTRAKEILRKAKSY